MLCRYINARTIKTNEYNLMCCYTGPAVAGKLGRLQPPQFWAIYTIFLDFLAKFNIFQPSASPLLRLFRRPCYSSVYCNQMRWDEMRWYHKRKFKDLRIVLVLHIAISTIPKANFNIILSLVSVNTQNSLLNVDACLLVCCPIYTISMVRKGGQKHN